MRYVKQQNEKTLLITSVIKGNEPARRLTRNSIVIEESKAPLVRQYKKGPCPAGEGNYAIAFKDVEGDWVIMDNYKFPSVARAKPAFEVFCLYFEEVVIIQFWPNSSEEI